MKKSKKVRGKKFLVVGMLLLAVALLAGGGFFIWKKVQARPEQIVYQTMSEATFPVLWVEKDGMQLNEMHGYRDEMKQEYVRDVITPVSADRQLTVQIKDYGTEISAVQMSVRSLDGTRLIDEQKLAIEQGANGPEVRMELSALLETSTEYGLELKLTLPSGTVSYYTRIFVEEAEHVESLLQFAKTFSDATLDASVAESAIVPYLQPSDGQTDSSFAYANLKSRYRTIIWDGMGMQREEEPWFQITEITPTQIAVTLRYTLQNTDSDGVRQQYTVKEFFCVREREGKHYLLDYERKAEQVFRGDQTCVRDGSIWMGIQERDATELTADENNSFIVFSYQNALWSYNKKQNELACLFDYGEETADLRNDYDQHDVHIVRLDENGNVDFMVDGYLNRGDHEGCVGICFYRYDRESNSVQELYYIPSDVSYQVLKEQLGSLSYVSGDDLCYVLYGNRIYSIDLAGSEYQEIVTDVQPDSYYMNAAGNRLVWQAAGETNRIRVMNMDTGKVSEITAADGEYLKPVGFLQKDLVFGRGRTADIIKEAGVDKSWPLYEVDIVDGDTLEAQETYAYPNVYVTEVSLNSSRIEMKRIQKDDAGTITELADDMLILNEAQTGNGITVKRSDKAVERSCYYIPLDNKDAGSMRFSTLIPSMQAADRSMVVTLQPLSQKDDARYFVYAGGELVRITDSLQIAIDSAYEKLGTVLTGHQVCCWNRDSRALSANVSLPAGDWTSQTGNSLATGIAIVTSGSGINEQEILGRLNAGFQPEEIVVDLAGGVAENLYGCTLSQVLYYLNQNQLVLAVTGSDSGYLLTGYTTTVIRVYDPATAQTEEWSMEEAENYFTEQGNQFLSVRK